MDTRYYRHSGAVPVVGAVMTIVAGVLVAAVLGYLYGAISFWNPFIYVNFLGALGVGFVPGIAIGMAAKAGRIRSPLFLVLVGVASALVALYFSWAGYILAILVSRDAEALNATTAVGILISPQAVVEFIQLLAEDGVWTIVSFRPTGVVLYIFWLVEAGIILGVSLMSAAKLDTPYCESCGVWTDAHEDVPVLNRRRVSELTKSLEEEKYEILDEMLKEDADPASCFLAQFHTCPRCEQSNFLSIHHLTITTNKDGEPESETTDIIKHIAVPISLVEVFTGKAKGLAELRAQAAFENVEEPESEDVEDDEELTL